MADLVTNVKQGGAKKAFAGSIGAVLSSEIISPFIDWGFDLIEGKWMIDVPDAVEVSTSVLVIAGIGFLVGYFAPANNIETERGLLIKPEEAKVTKAPHS